MKGKSAEAGPSCLRWEFEEASFSDLPQRMTSHVRGLLHGPEPYRKHFAHGSTGRGLDRFL